MVNMVLVFLTNYLLYLLILFYYKIQNNIPKREDLIFRLLCPCMLFMYNLFDLSSTWGQHHPNSSDTSASNKISRKYEKKTYVGSDADKNNIIGLLLEVYTQTDFQ